MRVNITANTGWPAGQISEFQIFGPTTTSASNLALNKPTSASSHTQNYVAGNATDGNQASYWESDNNAFPQWLQVDLGASVQHQQGRAEAPAGSWGARTQTLAVQGSTDNTNFTTWSPRRRTRSTAPATPSRSRFNATTTRYVRLNITANSVRPAGQLSELEVYGPTARRHHGADRAEQPRLHPAASGQIELTWNASTDNVGVTGYDIYLNNALLTSVPGTAMTYIDNEPDTLTATYFVRAHDAAGNQSGNSNSVTRTGQTGVTRPRRPRRPTSR